jgi:hypothetical protein
MPKAGGASGQDAGRHERATSAWPAGAESANNAGAMRQRHAP